MIEHLKRVLRVTRSLLQDRVNLTEPAGLIASFSPRPKSSTAYGTRLEPLKWLRTASLASLWLAYWSAMRLATGPARSQSERDLVVPEAAGRRAEGRASGIRRPEGAERVAVRWRSRGGAVCNLRHTPAPLVTAVAHGLFEGCTCEIGGESNVGN